MSGRCPICDGTGVALPQVEWRPCELGRRYAADTAADLSAEVTTPGCPECAYRAAYPLPSGPGRCGTCGRPAPAPTTIQAGDPNDRRMVRVIICWRCYCGEHDRCALVGAFPGVPGIGADCFCARIRHPEQMVIGGLSSRLYDATGRPVDGP